MVDATSIEPSARRALLARAAAAGIPASAIVLDLPAATVLARNAARPARVVDMAVVRRQLDRLRASLDGPDPALWREGLRPDRRPAMTRPRSTWSRSGGDPGLTTRPAAPPPAPDHADPAAMQPMASAASAIPTACDRDTRSRRKTVARMTVATG